MNTHQQTALLSNISLLHRYLQGDWPDVEKCRTLGFVRSRENNTAVPDFVYKNRQNAVFFEVDTLQEHLRKALDDLAKRFIHFSANRIHVPMDEIHTWHETLTMLPPLPIVAFAFHLERKRAGWEDDQLGRELVCLSKTALSPTTHPILNDLIAKHGLRELHVHLNGSTESDWIWQDALKKPIKFGQTISQPERGKIATHIQEQYLQLSDFIQPAHMAPMMSIAANIREILAHKIYKQPILDLSGHTTRHAANQGEQNGSGTAEYNPNILQEVSPTALPSLLKLENWRRYPVQLPRKPHPNLQLKTKSGPNSDIYHEALFLTDLFAVLDTEPNPFLTNLMHYYLLIQSYLNRLLVQQVAQTGFEQFDKITRNKIRDFSEDSYYHRRFQQLEGMHGEDLVFLEGRFAPKIKGRKAYRLISRIEKEYANYSNHVNRHTGAPQDSFGEPKPPKRMQLALVAHFIKQLPNKRHSVCQHLQLRRALERQARILIELRAKKQSFRNLVTGCDAAANELNTPPEVFAPIFRRMRHSGITNFTFHAGEDFVHLLSGIRAAYEAATFLDLRGKNRIGHGTALGICPQLWRRRVGANIMMRKPLWLDDLVFAWEMLQQENDLANVVNIIRDLISDIARQVYGENHSPVLLRDAWRMRHLDPLKAFIPVCISGTSCLDPFDAKEWQYIQEAKENNMDAFELFRQHHGKTINDMTWATRGRRNPFVEVKTDAIPIEAIERLQTIVLRELNRRTIAIETLPTSNVRISFYKRHAEHHIKNWMCIDKNRDNPEYPRPPLCICSDDPGIFATTLGMEYAHVLKMLSDSNVQNHQINNAMKELVKTSRSYSFVSPDMDNTYAGPVTSTSQSSIPDLQQDSFT